MPTMERTPLQWSTFAHGSYVANWSRGTAQITLHLDKPKKFQVQVFESGNVIYENWQYTKPNAERAAEYNIPK